MATSDIISEPQVLFAGNFGGRAVDEVIFSFPVIVTTLQVVASGIAAHDKLLPSFIGKTQSTSFQLEIFAKNVRVPQQSHFDQLISPVYTVGGEFLKVTKSVSTDHLVIRGVFTSLSLVLYGYALFDEKMLATLPPFFPPELYGSTTSVLSASADHQVSILPPPPVLPPAIAAEVAAAAAAARARISSSKASGQPEKSFPKPTPWEPCNVPKLPPSIHTVGTDAKQHPPISATFNADDLSDVDSQGVRAGVEFRKLRVPDKLIRQLESTNIFSRHFQMSVGATESAIAAVRRLRWASVKNVSSALHAATTTLRLCLSGQTSSGHRRESRRISSSEAFDSAVKEDLAQASIASLEWCIDTSPKNYRLDSNDSDIVRASRDGLRLLETMLTVPSLAYAFIEANGLRALRITISSPRVPVSLKAMAMGALSQLCQHDYLISRLTISESEQESVYEAVASALVQHGKSSASLKEHAEHIFYIVAITECLKTIQKFALEAGLAAVGETFFEENSSNRLNLLRKSLTGFRQDNFLDYSAEVEGGTGKDEVPKPMPKHTSTTSQLDPKPLLELARAFFALDSLLDRPCLSNRIFHCFSDVIDAKDAIQNVAATELLYEAALKRAEELEFDSQNRPFVPGLLRLFEKYGIVAALAVGGSAAAKATLEHAKTGISGQEGGLSSASSQLFAAVQHLSIRLLRGNGCFYIGSLIFAALPVATEVLVSALDSSVLISNHRIGGVLPLDACEDGVLNENVTPSTLAHMITRAVQAVAVAEFTLDETEVKPGTEAHIPLCLRQIVQIGITSEAGRGAAACILSKHLMPNLLEAKFVGAGAATAALIVTQVLTNVISNSTAKCLLDHWKGICDLVGRLAQNVQPVADWGTPELSARLLEISESFSTLDGPGISIKGLISSYKRAMCKLYEIFESIGDGIGEVIEEKSSENSTVKKVKFSLRYTELERMELAVEPLTSSFLSLHILFAQALESKTRTNLHIEGILSLLIRGINLIVYIIARKSNPALARRLRAQHAAETNDFLVVYDGEPDISQDEGSPNGQIIFSGTKLPTKVDTEIGENMESEALDKEDEKDETYFLPENLWTGDCAVADLIWPSPSETEAEEVEIWTKSKGQTSVLPPAEIFSISGRHLRQSLFLLVSILRLIRVLLLPFSGYCLLDELKRTILNALLDAQSALAYLPIGTPTDEIGAPQGAKMTSTAILAMRAEAIIADIWQLYLPSNHTQNAALEKDRDAYSETVEILYYHGMSCPAHRVGSLRLLGLLLPPKVPIPVYQLPHSLPNMSELVRSLRLSKVLEKNDGLYQVAVTEIEQHLAWHLYCLDKAFTPTSKPSFDQLSGVGELLAAPLMSSSPQVRALAIDAALRTVDLGPYSARKVAISIISSLRQRVEAYLAHVQLFGSGDKGGKGVTQAWSPVYRVLSAVHTIAEMQGGAGRIALLASGVLEALLPCLGLPRPEPIRAALLSIRPFCKDAGRAAETRKYGFPRISFSVVATAARNVMGKWHRVDLRVHSEGAQLLAVLASIPSCAAHVLGALRPRGAEAAGASTGDGKTTMLLPRLYAGLVKGLEDAHAKYRGRVQMASVAVDTRDISDAKKAEEVDGRVLLLARAACWAVLTPLALVTEGLVDATELSTVLTPQGLSPDSEPLTKLISAAEAFISQFMTIVSQVETQSVELLHDRDGKEKKQDIYAPDPLTTVAENTIIRLLIIRQYLTVLQDSITRLFSVCESIRGTRPSSESRVSIELSASNADSAPLQPMEKWFVNRPLIVTNTFGGIFDETRKGRCQLLEESRCFGCTELNQIISDVISDQGNGLFPELVDTPLVAAGGSALYTPEIIRARSDAIADVVRRAKANKPMPAHQWRIRRPKRKRAAPPLLVPSTAPATRQEPAYEDRFIESEYSEQAVYGGADMYGPGLVLNEGGSSYRQEDSTPMYVADQSAYIADARKRGDPRLQRKSSTDPRLR